MANEIIFTNKEIKFLDGYETINTWCKSPITHKIICKRYPFTIEADITVCKNTFKLERKLYFLNSLSETLTDEYTISFRENIYDIIDVCSDECKEMIKEICNGIKQWMDFSVNVK